METLRADSRIVPECIYRPGSFTGLMTMYESNYLKLHALLSGLDLEDTAWLSATTEDCDLYLSLLRSEPYTTTFRMTYWFDDPEEGAIADPDLIVRVYRDARLAEGVGGRRSHEHHVLRALAELHTLELDRRWRTNVMLNKWLDYLLWMQHRFVPAARRP